MKPVELYQALNLPDDPTASQLEAAWRQARSGLHPDKGGDAALFAAMATCYKQALERLRRPRPCPVCDGAGATQQWYGWSQLSRTCPDCGGSGLAKTEE